jgi:hypothetical protein
MLDEGQQDNTISKMLEETLSMVKGANSGAAQAVDHISAVKTLVETVGER